MILSKVCMQIAACFTLLYANLFVFDTIAVSDAWANKARLRAIERVKGLHERRHTARIKRLIGVNPRYTPWCGAAVSYAVRKAGGRPPAGPNRAISWTRFGQRVSLRNARPGDVVVFRFKRGHHVAIYKGRAKNGRVIACGGNMSNQFKCSNYRSRSVVSVRR